MTKNIKLIYFPLIVFCILISDTVNGQKHTIDSLYKVLNTEKEDTNKVNTLYHLTDMLSNSSEFSEVDSLAQIELQLATKCNFYKGIADALGNLGNNSYYLDDYSNAMNYYLKEQKLSDSIGYINGIADAYNGKGEIHEEQGDYKAAMDEEDSSLELYSKIVNTKGIASAENDIGNIYFDRGDDSLAFRDILYSLNLYEREGDTIQMESPLITLGEISEKEGKYSEALSYFLRARKYQEENGDRDGLSTSLNDIATIYLKMKKYGEALNYANNSLIYAYFVNSKDDIMKTKKTLADIYLQLGNAPKAIEYYKDYYNIHDSIYGPDNIKKTTNIERNYEFRVKQALEKAEQDKKDALEKAEEKRKNIVIIATVLCLLLAMIFGVILFNRFKITQKQKSTISEKNKEITDSINYAKKIQDAMLPSILLIKSNLPQSFVLFKPKDIVSGDFYFFNKVKNTIFFAAADCTGHGVPGGFMSMLCSEKLHDAVSQSQQIDIILQLVNRNIKTTLHQSHLDNSTKDGMDIALCAIEDKNISYAGANRPLWIIRKNAQEVEEIKPTKKAIGGYTEDEQTFELHKVELNQGDTFYMFSDGYADQFGGEKEKKLTTKKLREKLISIQNMSMSEQQRELDISIESWKGAIEQTDDILVIGARV